MEFLVNPERFFLAAFIGDFPFIAGAAVDGLCSNLLASCVLSIVESAGIAFEVLPLGRALRHGTVGVGRELHIHLLLCHEHVGRFSIAINDHAHLAAERSLGLALAGIGHVHAEFGKRKKDLALHVRIAVG